MNKFFQAYIISDWSAKNGLSPKSESKDAIWIAQKTGNKKAASRYCRSRHEAKEYLEELLNGHLKRGNKVFAGFDFSFGYPSGFANLLGNSDANKWEYIWKIISEEVKDNKKNENNRFNAANRINRKIENIKGGPFWGHPHQHSYSHLEPLSPYKGKTPALLPLKEKRLCEEELPGTQSTWKLFGNGSVGGQALLGISLLNEFRTNHVFSSKISVWPFNSGFNLPEKEIVFAEIWPGSLKLNKDSNKIKDEVQVTSFAEALHEIDGTPDFMKYFQVPILTSEQQKTCIEEEGWVFGVGTKELKERFYSKIQQKSSQIINSH